MPFGAPVVPELKFTVATSPGLAAARSSGPEAALAGAGRMLPSRSTLTVRKPVKPAWVVVTTTATPAERSCASASPGVIRVPHVTAVHLSAHEANELTIQAGQFGKYSPTWPW